ncbi:MAG: hypothetical protein U5J95_11410 [Balneolaceae bacterium]|nr:hypothetical protein [Balneolaceae bacterium]
MNNVKTLTKLTADATLSEIATVNGEAKELLASIGLNPLDHQDETLRSVCQQKKWSEEEVLKWVKRHANGDSEKLPDGNGKSIPTSGESLLDWVEYLEEQFLNPINNLLKEINENFPRVQKIHGNQYNWLKNMQWYYDKFSEGLRMYYQFEQQKFFPAVKTLANGRSTSIKHGSIQKLKRCLTIAERDQKRLSRLLKTIRRKGNDFESPDLACSTLCIMNENFKALEEKLTEQFKFEDQRLIPRIMKELKNKS